MNGKMRPLALVTGASGGIGAELARALARDGHDLVLAARGVVAMEELAAELRREGSDVIVIGSDLSQPDGVATLIADIAGRALEIDVLINNAGLGAAGRFVANDAARIDEIMQVNIVALTQLTRALLPGMIARGRGRVMLVASVAAFQPGPRMAVYFASKAYVLSLGEALSYELRGTGVTVTTLCPGATATKFFEVAGADHSLMAKKLRRMMRADRVAQIGYRALKAGRRVVITGLVNTIMSFGGRYAPHRLTLPVTDMLMSGD
ncbi:MAG: SDR family oxidoreductase [Alphaproteobacteria bacterium]|nr:SDR family oxidoreductase [Alphaproteobacteria bacterium]